MPKAKNRTDEKKSELSPLDKSITVLSNALNMAAKSGAFDLQQSAQIFGAAGIVFKAAKGEE